MSDNPIAPEEMSLPMYRDGERERKKNKILLLYPYYWPHYKAGGPVQSLFNLVSYFKDQADFYLLSLDCDIDGSAADNDIPLNQWSKGPNGENIFFSRSISFFLVSRIVREIKPDTILINGIFNINTTLPGIILGKLLGVKIIISPRGMLQPWALQRNKLVKRIFLRSLNLILSKSEQWHATTEQEKDEIRAIFGANQKVAIASNIPRKVSTLYNEATPPEKKIRLVFLSLINPNKNLHLIIEAVSRLKDFFILDIYGPVIDEAYWMSCKGGISSEAQITYKGPVPAWDVPKVLSLYHYFILPTEGENFGHAIFDSLSCGVPVVITRKTPWIDLDTCKAGFYVDCNTESIYNTLLTIRDMPPSSHRVYGENSLKYAVSYLSDSNYIKHYEFLLK